MGENPLLNTDDRTRCGWTGDDVVMRRSHDEDWGVPVHEDL